MPRRASRQSEEHINMASRQSQGDEPKPAAAAAAQMSWAQRTQQAAQAPLTDQTQANANSLQSQNARSNASPKQPRLTGKFCMQRKCTDADVFAQLHNKHDSSMVFQSYSGDGKPSQQLYRTRWAGPKVRRSATS